MRRGHEICFLLLYGVISFPLATLAQQSIAAVKNLPPGSVVTTTGTITNGDEYGQIRYMQDAFAGIALYAPSLAGTIAGDSIVVTGVLSSYQGELQLSPVISFQVISHGRAILTYTADDLVQIAGAAFTSRRARLKCTGIRTCEHTFTDGPYFIYDQFGHSAKGIVVNGQSIVGESIPAGALVLTGIWTSVNGQYQLLIQSVIPASESDCHLLPPGNVTYDNGTTLLSYSGLQQDATWIEWGVDGYQEQDSLGISVSDIAYALPVLSPGTLYQGRIFQVSGQQDTFYSVPVFFSTHAADPQAEIFFDRDIDPSYSDGSAPAGVGPSVIESILIQRLDQVSSSLDIAMYNTGRTTMVQAVNRAMQRGVAVRYIAEEETSNTALDNALFPLLYRSGDGIMHNKFVIADADDPSKAWVWTGSTNFTTNQLATDANHAYILHDQALAQNYKREFDEMWGLQPNHGDSRAGEFKTDNTAHQFDTQAMMIESYFSPSDEVDCHISQALASADHQLLVGLLLLTSSNLVDEIISAWHRGVAVRVILEDEASSPVAVARLREEGVPLEIHSPASIFHHKYAIIDEGYPESDPLVVTGSHNWTWSADHINDENTLIFHSQPVANIFRQEYEARWGELHTGIADPAAGSSFRVYPNPATGQVVLRNLVDQPCHVSFLTMQGTLEGSVTVPARDQYALSIPATWSNGLYLLRWDWKDQHACSKIAVLR